MSLTAYATAPYFDDFIDSGVDDKNYLRILFRPGYSVQARELTQLQTILQGQIDKFGRSIYVDGTPVIDGLCTFDSAIDYVDVSVASEKASRVPTVTQLRFTADEILTADVLKYRELAPTSYRFYIRYTSSAVSASTDENTSTFPIGEVLTYGYVSNGIPVTSGDPIFTVVERGTSSSISVTKGVYFAKGSFVQNEAQRIFLDHAPGTTLTGYAAFKILESTVTHSDDLALLDNANGSPNYAAPGAHRYAVNLELAYVDSVERLTESHLKLLSIGESKVSIAARTEYSNLERVLAQRTSEESGDYTIRPFMLDVRELLSDGTNRGKYEADDDVLLDPALANPKTKFVVGIEPSVAYVDGYRIELVDKLDLVAEKARTYVTVKDVNLSARQGNYIEGQVVFNDVVVPDKETRGMPDVSNSTLSYTLKGTTGESIGTCRVRGLEYVSTGTPYYRLYIYEIVLDPGKNITDVVDVRYGSGASVDPTNFTFRKSLASPLFENNLDTAIFRLPYDTIRGIQTEGAGTPKIVFKTRRRFGPNTSYTFANGVARVTITCDANSTFDDDTASNYIIAINGHAADWHDHPVAIVSGLGSSTLVLDIACADTLVAATDAITVLANVTSRNHVPRSKTKTTITNESRALSSGTKTLLHGDILSVASITTLDGKDVTSDFVIDNGQRADYYTFGSIRLKGASASVGSADTVMVTYDYFAHGGVSSYFSVDSYPVGTGGFEYSDIPSFGGTRLSDVLDFRPFSGIDSGIHPVDPNSVITTDATYYLPRTDSLVVNNVGQFSLVRGIPTTSPRTPATPDGAMQLYAIEIPAYTLNVSDVNIRYTDNRRYTMRDIGRLDRRLGTLEYYTSLSLLEQGAAAKTIIDDSLAIERFKNGILVDAFTGHNVGDSSNRAYACAMDTREGLLRPTYDSYCVRFGAAAAIPVTLKKNANTVTLAFTSVPLITQRYASVTESVNPYDVASWVGNIELSPGSDEWKSVTRTPDIMIDERGVYDSFTELAERSNALGTVWNEWTTNWTGVTGQRLVSGRWNHGQVATDFISAQSRSGTTTGISFADVERNYGDRVVDVSFVPFVRARKVYFRATLLKPNTRVYAFLDGVDITAYSTSTTYVPFSENLTVRTYDGLPSTAIDGLETPAPLITNENGAVSGFFVVPNNDVIRFRTGERSFRLTDSPTNALTGEATTWASEVYSAAGLLETKQATIVSTRIPQFVDTRVDETRSIVTSSVAYVDPLAQTFVIGDIATGAFLTSLDLYFAAASSKNIPVSIQIVSVENGVPTQKVLPFSRVTLNSVNVTTDASVPSSFVFSDPVYLQPGAEYAFIVMSNDADYRLWVSEMNGRDVTNQGTLEAPIYEVISKNPYAGVMLKSQNASTWTPDQNRDIKFTLKRAQFNPLAPGTLALDKLIPSEVASVTVTNAGAGYGSIAPSVIFTPVGPGAGAAAGAYLDGAGHVAGIKMTNPGSGYTAPPIITFDPSSTSAATAVLETATFSTMNLNVQVLNLPGTSVTHVLDVIGTSYEIDANENYTLPSEVAITNVSTLGLTSVLSTESEYISPVFDLDRVSVIGIRNIINDTAGGETGADLGSASARYLTKQINLNNTSDQLNIYLDANRPTSESNILVFAKVKTSDATEFSALPWTLLTPLSPIPVSTNTNDFSEVLYTYKAGEFSAFALKIVMTAKEGFTAKAPSARNLRVIATY